LLRRHVSKCWDRDFLAERIGGAWEQPQQTAIAMALSTRVLNNAERELIAKGFINRSPKLHAKRAFSTEGIKTFQKNDSWHQKILLNAVGWIEEEVSAFWRPQSSSTDLGGIRVLGYFTENDMRKTWIYEVPVLDSNGK
jgi:hypothetical protein